jgi:hypothetical protein
MGIGGGFLASDFAFRLFTICFLLSKPLELPFVCLPIADELKVGPIRRNQNRK